MIHFPYFQSGFQALFAFNTLFKTDKEPYDGELEKKVLAEQAEFLKKNGIRRDITIKARDTIGFAQSHGTNFYCTISPLILISPELETLDKHAFNWIVKHETGHLKKSDSFKYRVLKLTSSLVSEFGLRTLTKYAGALLPGGPFTGLVLEGCTQLLVYQFGEKLGNKYLHASEFNADEFALNNASLEEIMGGRRQLKALQQYARSNYREGHPFIMPNGDLKVATHPTYSERITKIEAALRASGVDIEKLEADHTEQAKIDALAKLAHQTDLNLAKKMGYNVDASPAQQTQAQREAQASV